MAIPYWIGIGDIHDSTANAARIPELAGAEAVLICGDLSNHGGAADAARIVDAVRAVNPRVWAQIGNMDTAAADAWLTEQGINLHVRVVELAPGVGCMGVGMSAPTPFGTPSEVPDTQLAAWLDQVHEQAKGYDKLLLAVHTPPMDTAADALPGGVHVGSPAVRAFIERVQPDVCLTGHIHEARSTDSIGRTRIVNPGTLGAGGYAVITDNGDRLEAEVRTV